METVKNKKNVKRKPIQYKITPIFDKSADSMKTVFERIFINYCMEEFEKIK